MGKNRTMEAKRIKYIRQSKARPRNLRINNGHQKTASSVDRSKVPKEFAGLFEYRDRAKTFIDDFLSAKFGLKRPIEDEIIQGPYVHVDLPPEPDRLMAVDVVSGKFTTITMMHTSRLDCVYFIEHQKIPGVYRKSITYGSYNRALQVLELRTIRWKEVLHIPNVESGPQP